MTWTSAFGNACGKLLRAIVNRMALARISPNFLTFLGLVIDTVAAFLFGYASADNQARMFFYAGLVIFGAGFFALFYGLLVYYSRGGRFFYVVLAALAMISSVMVSYTRARAESLIGTCKVGFMERPERLVLLIIGAVFNRMAPVLWVIAVLSTITVAHRIYYTWQQTELLEHSGGAPTKSAA